MTDGECLACSLVGEAFVARREAIGRELFAHAEAVEELEDGFAYRFPGFDPWAGKALEFIAVERACCPFFRFELVVEPAGGAVWLRLRGAGAVKAFIRGELDGLMPRRRRGEE